MTIVDAGPLIALIDADEDAHAECLGVAQTLRGPMVTTWPAFTEAMYLLGRISRFATDALWRMALDGRLQLSHLDDRELRRSAALMAKYHDVPMDLADATLVALAESRDERIIFTLDSDFQIYRFKGRQSFRLLPRPSGE